MKTKTEMMNAECRIKDCCRASFSRRTRFCFFILTSSFCLSAFGQSYSIDWYKITGGGGTSTGATYQVTGTIGQPDAGGAMTGGNYSLTGGFWSLIAVAQIPGAPTLTITQSGNTIKVSWPYPSTGWTLQQNSNLAVPANWTPSGSVSNDGVNNFITVNPPTGNLFFRLQHP
jgi:hypothetical protein